MEMTQTWIIFAIGNQQVYQMKYNGCTGQNIIDDRKAMVANEYGVGIEKIKVSFNDDELKTKRVVSYNVIAGVLDTITQSQMKN